MTRAYLEASDDGRGGRERVGPQIDAINAEPVDVPADLAEQVRDKLVANPDTSWDAAFVALTGNGEEDEDEG